MVTIAIITSMVKTVCEMTPISSPILSKTNSIKPRVFINTPSAAESRQLIPARRAAKVDPPNFLAIATMIIAAQAAHIHASFSRPMLAPGKCLPSFLPSPEVGGNSGIIYLPNAMPAG